ncbi:F-box only protein 34 [Notolabrus celidotus]|uniref:F-box only protein 34 n=1 Tax=Notolabrus celidotus TaxID=1203425 RepID=UPI0014901F5E|nr:F-box only protein 34 [Notolabrus celidotus]
MHLESCPQLGSGCGVVAPSVHQGVLLRSRSSNHGSGGRVPLSVLSTNTLGYSDMANQSVFSVHLKVSPCAPPQRPPQTENAALRLHQTTPGDAETSLDIWTVIKPGHVREKIAIFAAEGQRTEAASSSDSRDRTPSVCQSHAPMAGVIRAVKAKGSWEENCSAKRRRRSGHNLTLQQDQRTRVLNKQQFAKPAPTLRSDMTQQSNGVRRAQEVTAEEEQKVSVGEMVAFLEQRASEQPDSKPLLTLQRSSASITLSRAPPPELRDDSEVLGEESESVKVSDMVAKLESECLRRRAEGDLSRSNSLRRSVGRVLLATGDQSPAPYQRVSSQSSVKSSVTSSSTYSSLLGVHPAGKEPISCSETPTASTMTPPSSPRQAMPPSGAAGEKDEVSGLQGGATPHTALCEVAEPLPGLLFLSPAAETRSPSGPVSLPSVPAPLPSGPAPPFTDRQHSSYRTTCDHRPRPFVPCSSCGSQSERRRLSEHEQVVCLIPCSAVPPGRRASASQDFLLMRQRLQQLLEPQPYLLVLPHHVLVKIFLLLPTQSLAALKCSCQYFAFVIDSYGVRPADSLWVSDPRYRDDPCKQCKKRYCRGDVSLCRWHHKPYCQALPYGPGYWMCCHGAHRDALGCNVGLHDNRWVPAFHSINVPIYCRHDN